MRKRFLITTGLLILFTLPSFAELTVEDSVSPEFLKNSGYSTSTINAAQKSIAQSNGELLAEPLEHKYYDKGFVKFVRRVFMYLDPSLDDHSFMNDHEIHTAPNIHDL